MRVEHFGGVVVVADGDSLDLVLSARFGDGANEVWMSSDGGFPRLAILVRGSIASVHFFPHDDHPGFKSMGEGSADGVETFYTNTPTEEIWVGRDAIVRFAQARDAAHEFFRTGTMPSSIRWFEL